MMILNGRPYSDGQENPIEALRVTLSFSVDDWGSSRAMAWVWGIVNGWDDEAMDELAREFGWDKATTDRLNRLHATFDALGATGEGEPQRHYPDDNCGDPNHDAILEAWYARAEKIIEFGEPEGKGG